MARGLERREIFKFVEKLRAADRGRSNERITDERVVPSFDKLKDAYCRMRGEDWESIRDRHGDAGRDFVLLAARDFGRKTLRELA